MPHWRDGRSWRGAPPGAGMTVLAGLAGAVVGAAVALAPLEHRRRGTAERVAVTGLAAIALGLAAASFGWSWPTLAVDGYLAGALRLAAVDVRAHRLPRRGVYATGAVSGAGLLVAAAEGGRWGHLGVATACGLVCFAAFFAVNRARPAWLGFGDVRLVGVMGLVLGWIGPGWVLLGLLAANGGGVAAAASLMAAGRIGWRTPLPYGAFLAGGSAVALLVAGLLTGGHR